jgi:hypothetical protein
MHHGAGQVRALHFGFDLERLYLRLDFAPDASPMIGDQLSIELLSPRPLRVRAKDLRSEASFEREGPGGPRPLPDAAGRTAQIAEIELSIAALGLRPGETVEMLVQVMEGGEVVESVPPDDVLRLVVPGPRFEAEMWSA